MWHTQTLVVNEHNLGGFIANFGMHILKKKKKLKKPVFCSHFGYENLSCPCHMGSTQ